MYNNKMKNNPKTSITTSLIAITLLGSHGIMKDAHSQVHQLLCESYGKRYIAWENNSIKVMNEP